VKYRLEFGYQIIVCLTVVRQKTVGFMGGLFGLCACLS
jgi:hypothetical protein